MVQRREKRRRLKGRRQPGLAAPLDVMKPTHRAGIARDATSLSRLPPSEVVFLRRGPPDPAGGRVVRHLLRRRAASG